jgi:SET domain-containing protein
VVPTFSHQNGKKYNSGRLFCVPNTGQWTLSRRTIIKTFLSAANKITKDIYIKEEKTCEQACKYYGYMLSFSRSFLH